MSNDKAKINDLALRYSELDKTSDEAKFIKIEIISEYFKIMEKRKKDNLNSEIFLRKIEYCIENFNPKHDGNDESVFENYFERAFTLEHDYYEKMEQISKQRGGMKVPRWSPLFKDFKKYIKKLKTNDKSDLDYDYIDIYTSDRNFENPEEIKEMLEKLIKKNENSICISGNELQYEDNKESTLFDSVQCEAAQKEFDRLENQETICKWFSCILKNETSKTQKVYKLFLTNICLENKFLIDTELENKLEKYIDNDYIEFIKNKQKEVPNLEYEDKLIAEYLDCSTANISKNYRKPFEEKKKKIFDNLK